MLHRKWFDSLCSLTTLILNDRVDNPGVKGVDLGFILSIPVINDLMLYRHVIFEREPFWKLGFNFFGSHKVYLCPNAIYPMRRDSDW